MSGSTITNGNEHEISSYRDIDYTYLNDEHLIGVTNRNVSPNDTYDLRYDALGRCVKRTIRGVTNYYVYDGEKPILEYNSSAALVGRNVYGKGVDEILTRTDYTVNQTYYYQQDHEGSVTHLTSATGTVIESYRYDAFGAPTTMSSSGTYNNRFKFTGREYTATFSFYEYRARAYHPGLGRFMSEDPKLFDAGDYNLFRYCHNDPLDLTDPMGLGGGSEDKDPRTYEQLKAREHALGWPGHGAIEIGRLRYAIGQMERAMGSQIYDPIKNGKPYLESSDYRGLGNKVGIMAEEKLQGNPSEHEELSIVSQNKNGSRDFIASLPAAQYYNGKTQKNYSNVYDRNDPRQVDPSPRGYRAVANVVAQKLWVPFIDPRDRVNIHRTGLDAFIAMPGQPGTNEGIKVRFYDEGNVHY